MLDRLRRHADVLVFAALVLVWVYQTAVGLQSELRFTADSERDLFHVLGLTQHGVMPTEGIRMAALGLDLGPLYFLLIAPLTWLWPSPQTVHLFNVALGVVGLVAIYALLRKRAGITAALIFTLLYTQASGTMAFFDTIWHTSAAPSVALAFMAAAGWWVESGRRLALGLAAGALCFLVQIHALGAVYGPAALLLLIALRSKLDRRSLITLVVVSLVVLLPLILYAIPSLSVPSTGAAKHEGGFSFQPVAYLSTLAALVRPRALLSPQLGGWLILALAAVGLVGTGWRLRKERPWFRIFVTVQVVIGSIAVACVIPYEAVGRYFLPAFGPVFVIAAFGVADIDALLTRAGRVPAGRAATWIVLLGCVAFARPARTETEPMDYLTAAEQEAVVTFFVEERGLSWARLRSHVHGAFFGPLSGIRYLERIHRDQRGELEPKAASDHWLVVPDGMDRPQLAGRVIETRRLTGNHRPIDLVRFSPVFDPGAVTASGVPCPWPFPYLWSEAPADLLKLNGFPLGHGRDLHQCFAEQATNTLTIPLAAGADEVTIQFSDGGHYRGEPPTASTPVAARLVATDAPELPLAIRPVVRVEKLWYVVRVPPHDSALTLLITVNPRGHLGFLDVY